MATPTRTESEFTLNGLWIGPSPQPSPPRRRLRAILAAVVALAVFGGALAAAVEALRGNASSRPGVASPTTAPGDVSAVLPELERFVEKQRGLRFTTPVRADLLDDAAFTDRLRQVNSRDADPARTTASQVSLTALGLLPPGTDLQAQTDRLLGATVLGYYDPKTKALVVRGSRATPGVRATLAHELTHALQDQHFNLDRPDLDRALDESSLAFSGLAEGDAELVRSAYELTFSPSELSAADRETSSGAIPDVPPVLLQMVAFPYSAGPKFVGDLMQAGGQARVDAAFAAPPTSTEQLIDPARYLAGEAPKPVPVPAGDGPKADEGILGELGLRLALGPAIDQRTVTIATDGWGGDRYVAWRDGARSCLRDTVVMDSARDTDELRQALRAWSRNAKAATKAAKVSIDADTAAGITFTACQ